MSINNVNTDNPASFEEAMTELDKLVSQLEAGELPLEASIAAYQRGAELVRYCSIQLEKVDNQVKILDKEMLKTFQVDNSSGTEA